MKLSRLLAAGAAIVVTAGLAWAAGNYETYPIVGQPSFCVGTVTGAGGFNAQGNVGGGGVTGQGQASSGSICAQTVPAGPPGLTGNELVPADTGAGGGTPVQSVTIPSGLLLSASGSQTTKNALIGSDFGIALWQRGATPLSAVTPASAAMGPDGWYLIELNQGAAMQTMTVSKQTGAADQPPLSAASARVQRVSGQTGVNPVCTGQLVRDVDFTSAIGKTAIFSVQMLAGANFSPTNGNVWMVIAYHSAADVTTPAANGQGTNTGTFASSYSANNYVSGSAVGNIANYTEAVAVPTPITTTWTNYSVAAAIPSTIPNTSTAVLGGGVKLCWVPTGTAGTNDWLEFGKAQLEFRFGSSVGPSPYLHRDLADEYGLELGRYYQISETGSAGTPFYATGYAPATSLADVMVQFPTVMWLTPVTSPITAGGFQFMAAGTKTSPSSIAAVGQNTPRTAGIAGVGVGSITAGQGTMLTASGAGTGVLGFSAEP